MDYRKARQQILHRLTSTLFYVPAIVVPFLGERTRGVTWNQKWRLVRYAFRNARLTGSATTFPEQLALVRAILSIPEGVEGDIAEFGCFKGMSSATIARMPDPRTAASVLRFVRRSAEAAGEQHPHR